MFLRLAKWYGNTLAGKLITSDEFESSNFLLGYDFGGLAMDKGWISFNLEFDQETNKKYIFIALTISEETMAIDKDGIVNIY